MTDVICGHAIAAVCSLGHCFVSLTAAGLLVSYCHAFDLKLGGRRIYYMTTVAGNIARRDV